MIDLVLYEAYLVWHFGANNIYSLWFIMELFPMNCLTINLILVIAYR